MFYRDKIIQALNDKRAALTELDAEQQMRLNELYAARDALAGVTAAELCERLARKPRRARGLPKSSTDSPTSASSFRKSGRMWPQCGTGRQKRLPTLPFVP